MAISLSGFKQEGQRRGTAERLAKEYAKQQKAESKRSGWSKLLGGVGGKLLGTALAGLSGGLLAPLLGAVGSFGAKKLAHEATKGMGARTGALTADKFGYGKGEAKTLREGLEEQSRFKGDFGQEVFGKYLTAGMEGAFGDKLKGILTKKTPKIDASGNIIEPKDIDILDKASPILEGIGQSTDIDMNQPYGGVGTEIGQSYETDLPAETFSARDISGAGTSQSPIMQTQEDDQSWSTTMIPGFQQGGMVSRKAPTISEYFNMQGKTLGGSNNKSLAQMLGR